MAGKSTPSTVGAWNTFYDEEVHRYVDVEHERGEVLYHFAIGHPVAGPRFKR